MKTKMFVVFDSKKEVYEGPFFADSVGSMERAVYEEFKAQKSDMAKYPADMVLFLSGELDRFKGEITQSPHINIGTVLEIAVRFRNEEILANKQLEIFKDENEISNGAQLQPGADSIDTKKSV